MPFGEPYVVFDTAKYRVDLPSYIKRDAVDYAPVVRDGQPSGDTEADQSEIGWRTWHGGAFLATWRANQPDRYAYGYNVWPIIPGQITNGPQRQTASGLAAAVIVLKTPDAAGRVVALTAADVFYRDAGLNSFTSVLTATPTDIVEFDGNYLVAMGNAAAYQYKSALSATGWTTSNLGTAGDRQLANLWATDMADLAGGGVQRLWKSVSPNKVYSSADPTNGAGNWSTPYYVGSSKFNINSLRIVDDRLLVGKPEGLFWVRPDGTPQPLFSFRDAIQTNNAQFLIQSHTGLIMAPWAAGLVGFRPGSAAMNITLQSVWQQFAPSVALSDRETRGRVVAACAGPTLTYFILNDTISGNYYLLVWTGEDVDRGWHVVHKFGSTDASVIGFEQPSSGNPRVYTKNASSSPFYFVLPQDTLELRNDPNITYETTGVIEMSEYESPLPEIQKTYSYVDLRAENLAAGARSVLVEYSLDGGGYSTLGTLDTSGSTRMQFPANTHGRRMLLRMTLTGSSTNSPRVRALYMAYFFNPVARKEWLMRISSAPGTGDNRTPFEVESALNTAKSGFNGLTLIDLDDETFTAIVKSVGVQVEEAKQGGSPQWWVSVRLLQHLGTSASLTPGSYGALESLGDYSTLEARTYGQLKVVSPR